MLKAAVTVPSCDVQPLWEHGQDGKGVAMQTNRHIESEATPWGMPQASASVPASYRRGILRARVAVSDLTCWSARMDSMEMLKPGTTLWLTLPGLEARYATVTWVQGFTAGLRFDAPLHPAIVDAVLEGRTGRLH